MDKNVIPSLWLFLLSFFVSHFPYWFVLPRYEKVLTDFPKDRKFLILYFVQGAWFFLTLFLAVFVCAFLAKGQLSQLLAVFSMFYVSIFLPSAIISAATGIYPIQERKGYYYYANHKSPSGETLVSTYAPHLKTVGWFQSILIAIVEVVSLAFVLW